MGVLCDKYGFFNGIYGIEQANWANYWKGIVPDGVVANSGTGTHKEMEVYPVGGMQIGVASGECMVDNHKGWMSSPTPLTIGTADTQDPRIDTVVCRVVYGNMGESYMELDVVQGEAGVDQTGNPVPPTLDKTTGGTYEYALANILVAPNKINIEASDISDQRYVFSMGAGAISTFSETYALEEGEWTSSCVLAVNDGREYRATNTICHDIEIVLPENPTTTFICEVDFTSGTMSTIEGTTVDWTFNAITFKRNGSEYNIKSSNLIVTPNARYNLLIWWDGAYYWCDCKAV